MNRSSSPWTPRQRSESPSAEPSKSWKGVRTVLVALLATGMASAAACSSDTGRTELEGNGSGGNGTGATGTGGTVIPTGTGGDIIPTGSGGEGSGGTPTGPIEEPPPEPCAADGTCAEGFICTVADQCGAVGNSCTSHSECQGDTYCCAGDCRKDGVDEGICIPGNVGPGAECKGEVTVGVFSPAVQCEWSSNDAWGSKVTSSPLVGDLPNDSGESGEIVFVSFEDGNADTTAAGAVRIIRGDDCTLLETVEASKGVVRANTTPAIADLDADGNIDIVAIKATGGLIAFHWDGSKFDKWWESTSPAIGAADQVWTAVSIHNLDGGAPEVLVGTKQSVHTFNGTTGAEIGSPVLLGWNWNGITPAVGDFNADGKPELLTNTSGYINTVEWQGASGWEAAGFATQIGVAFDGSQFAFADFGTDTGSSFDATQLDGIAEIVAVDDEATTNVAIFTLDGDTVMNVVTPKEAGSMALQEGGGPPVIGDFDNDGFPEVGVAGATQFRIFDLDCAAGGAGCEANYIRWSQSAQDWSRKTGASIFDFDGDGKAEAVYADECFLRVYDGQTGNVLFSSYRTSATWHENPVVADADKDQNTEIIVNSAQWVGCPMGETGGTAYVDPFHPGVPCLTDADCVSGGTCGEGYCRCNSDDDCDPGLTCRSPLSGSGNTCRATHPNDTEATGGIRVLRDRLDRWASSRPLWNQANYSVTNINDDGTVPTMSEWAQNFTQSDLNNYRQNKQGDAAPDDIPDVTGKMDRADLCKVSEGKLTLTARVCNRGRKSVGSALPATFYDESGNILCVSYTQTPVQGFGDCRAVSCQLTAEGLEGEVKMVVNDDGEGGRTTVECRSDNNEDVITLEKKDCVILK